MKIKSVLFLAAVSCALLATACGGGPGPAEQPQPPGFVPPPRPPAFDTPPRSPALDFFREQGVTVGINLGNSLDAVRTWGAGSPVAEENVWGNPIVTQAIFDGMSEQGFNLVRIPATWIGHIGPGPGYEVSAARLARVGEIVTMARNAGLNVILNIHHDGRTYSPVGNDQPGTWLSIHRALGSPAERDRVTGQFRRVWEQIAAHFRDYGEWLMFQGFNELHVGDWGIGNSQQYEIINDWNQVFVDAVRGTGGGNAYRLLVISGYNTTHQLVSNPVARMSFRLPSDPSPGRLIVNFHFYQPFGFTHDGSTHIWPPPHGSGTPEWIDNVFAGFRDSFVAEGIPVIIGEMGPRAYNPDLVSAANRPAAIQNRLAYVAHTWASARAHGLVPTYWDDGGNFRLFNRNSGRPDGDVNAAVVRMMVDAVGAVAPPWEAE